MGFFKDLLKLRRMSKDWEDDYDVAAALADAKRQMASATDALQAAAGAVDLAGGERATAQVTATRTTGMLVNRSPMLQIDLMVFRVGYPPYPADRNDVIGLRDAGSWPATFGAGRSR